MKFSQERVAALSALLVDRLTGGDMIEPVGDRKTLIRSLSRVITEELGVEDRINVQAQALLQQYETEIARGHLDKQELFAKIKKQLVKTQGAIL